MLLLGKYICDIGNLFWLKVLNWVFISWILSAGHCSFSTAASMLYTTGIFGIFVFIFRFLLMFLKSSIKSAKTASPMVLKFSIGWVSKFVGDVGNFLHFVMGVIASERDSNISFLLLSGHLVEYCLMVDSLLWELSWMMWWPPKPALSSVEIT